MASLELLTEVQGALPRVFSPTVGLGWAPLAALLGALAGWRGGRPGGQRAWAWAPALGLACAVAVLLLGGLQLRAVDGAARLLTPGWSLLQLGTLDARADLALDPMRAWSGIGLAVAGLVATLPLARSCALEDRRSTASRQASLVALVVGAGLLVLLSDGLLPTWLGWEILGVASWLGLEVAEVPSALPRHRALTSFALQRAGDGFFLAALGLLLWGLGGQWTEEGYFPQAQPRFVAHVAGAASAEPGTSAATAPDSPSRALSSLPPRATPESLGKVTERLSARGFVSMTAMPGAKVWLGVYDGAQLRGTHPPAPLAVSPFLHVPVPAGRVSLAIVPPPGVVVGGGHEASLLRNVTVEPGGETTVLLVGPSTSWSDLSAQASVRTSEGRLLLGQLGSKPLLGTTLSAWLSLTLTLGWLFKAGPLLVRAWTLPSVAGTWTVQTAFALSMALPAFVLVVQSGSVFPRSAALTWVLRVGAVALIALLWRRHRRSPPSNAAAPVHALVLLATLVAGVLFSWGGA